MIQFLLRVWDLAKPSRMRLFRGVLTGIFAGRWNLTAANPLSIIGMLAVFAGGIVRVYAP